MHACWGIICEGPTARGQLALPLLGAAATAVAASVVKRDADITQSPRRHLATHATRQTPSLGALQLKHLRRQERAWVHGNMRVNALENAQLRRRTGQKRLKGLTMHECGAKAALLVTRGGGNERMRVKQHGVFSTRSCVCIAGATACYRVSNTTHVLVVPM